MGLSPPYILFPSGSYLNEVAVRFKYITLYQREDGELVIALHRIHVLAKKLGRVLS